MASSRMVETRYQEIVKDINKKLKHERSKCTDLEREIASNKQIVANTRKLERELQANALVLKGVKSDLDTAKQGLEKATRVS